MSTDEKTPDPGISLISSTIVTTENGAIVRELTEIGLDLALDDELLKKVPVIGILYSVGKTLASIPDKIFAKKVLRFLAGVGELPEGKASRWIGEMNDESDTREFGERVLTVLDAFNAATKAKLLGRLFRGLLQGRCDRDEFLRLSDMLSAAYESDISYLVQAFKSGLPIAEDGDEVRNLIATGFAYRPAKRLGEMIRENVQPELSDYGQKFLELVTKCE